MSGLTFRHCEATAELALRDTFLLPSAFVTARSALDTALRVDWLVAPATDVERETRYVALVREGIRLFRDLGAPDLPSAAEHAHVATATADHVDAACRAGAVRACAFADVPLAMRLRFAGSVAVGGQQ